MPTSSSQPSSQHPEVIHVAANASGIKCDGGGGPLGHPQVYYSFDGGDEIVCGYCDRCFRKG